MEISDSLIKSASGEYDVEVVRRLTIDGAKIGKIACLERCHRLVELNLPRNKIVVIEGLDNLASLVRLDLAANMIRRLDGLGALQLLENLDLRDNKIPNAEDAENLTALPQLVHLHLKGNPCAENYGYYKIVTTILPQVSVPPVSRIASCPTSVDALLLS